MNLPILLFIHCGVLKKNYETFFFNNILNNVTNINNYVNIYADAPYNIVCLDEFTQSSASKSCFVLNVFSSYNCQGSNDYQCCKIISSCKKIDTENYAVSSYETHRYNVNKLVNCNGKLETGICTNLLLSEKSNIYNKHKKISNNYYQCANINDCYNHYLIQDKCDCYGYYRCQKNGNDWLLYKESCPLGNRTTNERLCFDNKYKNCNLKHLVNNNCFS